MTGKFYARATFVACVCALIFSGTIQASADDLSATRDQLLQLQQQLQKQQELIDSLNKKVSALEATNAQRDAAAEASAQPPPPEAQPAIPIQNHSPFHFGNVDISGEGGLAFFKSGPNGSFPNSTFRIDEARLFIEAPVWDDVYFYSETDLATRETTSLGLNVGELYLDFEDVSKFWGVDGLLNIRAGRFYIPYGEEYMYRFAIDNPLISHSLSDLWGADDGIEAYGKVGIARYAVAVQNGGGNVGQALQGDKSVAGRIGVDPYNWLHLSVSGMRTGNLNVKNGVSAIWFGGGFFRSIGSPHTTWFHANLVEADVQFRAPFATLHAAGGYVNYDDNDPLGSNERNIYYYYLEATHDWTRHFYSAARWSQILAHNGYSIVGNGSMRTYGFGELTEAYWRLSLGLGYRFSPNLLLKGEYSLNQGHEPDGTFRGGENQFSLEAAFKF